MLLNCGIGEDSWKSLGLQGDPTSPSWRRSVLGVHWKDWGWSWNSNTLATWCEELTHWKRKWQPIPVFLPGESQGQGSLAGCIYGVAQSRTWLKWLSRLIVTFLPRSNHLLISWLQSPSAMILEPQKIKSVTVSIVSPSICHEVMESGAMIFQLAWYFLSSYMLHVLVLYSLFMVE